MEGNKKIESSGEANPLEAFRERVKKMVEQELSGDLPTAHLIMVTEEGVHRKNPDFNPDELTEKDMVVEEKIAAGTMTSEELAAYDEEIAKPGVPESRKVWASMMGNRMGTL